MTGRAYYTDAYTTRFASVIQEISEEAGRPAVRLAQTYFYPTSGGQPNDTGHLRQGEQTARVLDVLVREADDAVLHILDRPLSLGEATGEIDWPRRFDHMQQHTGQHILSQAFIRIANLETVGFHLSPQSVTIDLDRADVTPDVWRAAELLVNEIIWENRAVCAREVSRAEAAALSLRKVPSGRDDRLRLIDIDGFDLTACGGTHVAHTGAVGVLKVLKVERRGAGSRVEFCCGGRALADYRQKHDVVTGLGEALTTGQSDLLPAVARLQEDAKGLRAALKRQAAVLLRLEVEQLLGEAESLDGARLVCRVFDGREVDELRQLGKLLTEAGGTVALLGRAGEQAQLVFCRSADAPGAMDELIKPALALLGQARGGGGPAFAQGGGPPADRAAVAVALAAACARLRAVANAVE
jgi:alanyl-tRNA synthetase